MNVRSLRSLKIVRNAVRMLTFVSCPILISNTDAGSLNPAFFHPSAETTTSFNIRSKWFVSYFLHEFDHKNRDIISGFFRVIWTSAVGLPIPKSV